MPAFWEEPDFDDHELVQVVCDRTSGMTAIIALLLWEPVIPYVSTPLLGTIALWVAAILTLWSMFHYLRLAAPHFIEHATPAKHATPPAVRRREIATGKGSVDPVTSKTLK